MRLLALFFAFYFAILSCMSCTDEAPACKDQTQTTVVAASHSDCRTGALGDWCSPLCQCHCCGGAVMPLPSAPAVALAPLTQWAAAQRHGYLVVAAPTRGSGAVWQPPQA
ncbi:DUF6660 family protein [Hymenobacter rigui]|uniref:Secreted protein n=1 Tax=Hymenobacter rigui TaxID=334424 RepID=A0A3R9P6T7_9BACT|nr:DUF6660 family protein [Hymenobacter rigui]RSK45449.1 hypothetical protein EI291_17780 [Hymenobacter rigui]